MKVTYTKYVEKDKTGKDKTGFMLINFDYEDGNDYLAKIFCEKYDMVMDEKKDYIYFSILDLHTDHLTYEMLWHEDIGNSIYPLEQDPDSINVLEARLKTVLDVLNMRLREK